MLTHLNDEQMEKLLDFHASSEEGLGDGPNSQYDSLIHLRDCEICQARLGAQKFAMARMDNLRSPSEEPLAPECPNTGVWYDIASGAAKDNAAKYIDHAADCDHCGPLLRTALAEISDDLTSEEEEKISHLRTSSPIWQRNFAGKLAQSHDHEVSMIRDVPNVYSWIQSLSKPRIWIPISAMLFLLASIVGIRFVTNQNVQNLLAFSYTQDRTLECRIQGAEFAPLQQSGVLRNTNPDRDETSSLLQARAMIANALGKGPNDPRWLELQARADLLDGDFDRSLETTRRLLLSDPKNRDLLLDASSAYFERGQLSNDPQDLGNAIDLLGKLLAYHPRDPIGLYNQAVAFEHLYQYDNADRTWRRFLDVEGSGLWAEDARRHLAEVEKRVRQHTESENGVISPRGIEFSTLDGKKISGSDEELSTLGLPSMLTEAYPQRPRFESLKPAATNEVTDECSGNCEPARSALHAIAASLESNHGDPWLSDFLKYQNFSSWTDAVNALANAIHFNSIGLPSEATHWANVAVEIFQEQKNFAGEARARVELVYASQRLLDARGCLEQGRRVYKMLWPTRYHWMQSVFAVDYASCFAMEQQLGRERELLIEGQNIAEASHFRIAALRISGIMASNNGDLGNYESAWRQDIEGLKQFWDGNYPALRAYQFYSDLAYIEAFRSRRYLSLYAHQEALAEIKRVELLPVEAATRMRLVQALIRTGDESEAEIELQSARRLFAHVSDTRELRTYMSECLLDLARLKIDRHESVEGRNLLREVEGDLVGVENPSLRISLDSLRAQLLLDDGEWQNAYRELKLAADSADKTASHIATFQERMDWLRQAEPIYAGLVLASFQSNHDSRKALAEWERYRIQFLGPAVAFPCIARLSACIPNAIQNEQSAIADGVVVGNIVFARGVLVWRLDKHNIEMKFIPIEKADLIDATVNFVDLVRTSDSREAAIHSAGLRLFQLLLAPIWLGSESTKTLFWDPDACLSSVPVAAFPIGETYLGLAVPIANIFSLLQDDRTEGRPVSNKWKRESSRAMVIGNPAVPASLAPPLKDAIDEANDVAENFRNPILLVGRAATKSSVLRDLGSVSAFHFAGHTQSWTTRTRLLLSTTSVELARGTIPALDSTDVFRHPPRLCRLAVLSACSTGKRDSLEPEFMSDIVRSLVQTGVPEIVATAWDVDSAASARLMKMFYRELAIGDSVPVALSKSQAAMAAYGFGHPRFWSSFYAVGFGRTDLKEILDGSKEAIEHRQRQ